MGPGNYGFFPVRFLPIFWLHYSLFIRDNDNNRYKFFGSFFYTIYELQSSMFGP